MSTTPEYRENRERVFEIQGVDKKRKDINCHHIIQRCDLGILVPLDFDIDAKSNLFPVTLIEHEYINNKIRLDI